MKPRALYLVLVLFLLNACSNSVSHTERVSSYAYPPTPLEELASKKDIFVFSENRQFQEERPELFIGDVFVTTEGEADSRFERSSVMRMKAFLKNELRSELDRYFKIVSSDSGSEQRLGKLELRTFLVGDFDSSQVVSEKIPLGFGGFNFSKIRFEAVVLDGDKPVAVFVDKTKPPKYLPAMGMTKQKIARDRVASWVEELSQFLSQRSASQG